MINLLGKTDDFIKMINLLSKKPMVLYKKINLFSKTDDFIKMINLLNKTDDFIKNDKFS